MNKEEIYKFNDFVISYDKGFKDRSALIISKIDKINIYILGELYDESADIVNTIINNLQQENKQLTEEKQNVINYIVKELVEINKHQYAKGSRRLKKILEIKGDSNE